MFSLLCHHYDSERSLLAFTRTHGTASNSTLLGRWQGAYTEQTPAWLGAEFTVGLLPPRPINSLDFVLLALVPVQSS